MPEIAPDWIALDCGPSQIRAWAMNGADTPLAEARADLAPDAVEPALRDLTGDWTLAPGTPVIACGSLGKASFRSVPCTPLGPDAPRLPCADPRLDIHLVPGLSQTAPPDLMQGEETRIAGFLSMNPDFDGVICLPGRHTRWARISAGEVVSFQTAITGELTDHLSETAALDPTPDDDAFAAAVSDTLSRPETIVTRLFSLRAAARLGTGPASRARLAGCLIGAELAATRAYWLGMEIALIGDRAHADSYAAALAAQGVPVTRTRADTLTLRGLAAARRAAKETR